MTSRKFIFTICNPTASDDLALKEGNPDIKYIYYGSELAPTTGTPHYQGWVVLTKVARVPACGRILGGRASVRIMRGSPDQNKTYCSKDGDVRSWGEAPPGQGKRADLDTLRDGLRAGQTLVELADGDHFGSVVRYHRGLSWYAAMVQKPRTHKTKGIIYWGVTGAGKSTSVHEQAPDAFWLMSSRATPWWCGYRGQSDVVIDEFGYGQLSYSFVLRLLDRFPLRVETKGGSVQFVALRVWFTSNRDPRDWWPNVPDKSAFFARVTIKHFASAWVAPVVVV